MNDAAARLAVIGGAVPVDLGGAILVESWSNDTWMTGRFVLRVCWRGDRERLLREWALLASLPHAVALTAGRAGDLTWLVLERLAGERLDLAWPRLTGRLRQEAVISLGTALGALHQWAPPAGVREMLAAARPRLERLAILAADPGCDSGTDPGLVHPGMRNLVEGADLRRARMAGAVACRYRHNGTEASEHESQHQDPAGHPAASRRGRMPTGRAVSRSRGPHDDVS
ncbi:MAG TPA: hypothetical protein VIJ82_08695 [Streptosporangiaceae bacterium]|jgi:hypothetical protein